MLLAAEDELLAPMAVPRAQGRRLSSTNPRERLHAAVKRRTKVVGVLPNRQSVVRLVGAVLMELQEEWQAARRYFSPATLQPLMVVVTPS